MTPTPVVTCTPAIIYREVPSERIFNGVRFFVSNGSNVAYEWRVERLTKRINYLHAQRLHLKTMHECLQVCGDSGDIIFIVRLHVCNATHGIAKAFLSVGQSVCPSDKRVHCDITKVNCGYSYST